MVDVGGKPDTEREAVAEAFVAMTDETRALLIDGSLPKGDAVGVARIAAIQATKRTADLIPLCHPLALSAIDVVIEAVDSGVRLVVTVRTTDRTGVEMEALTGASIGALSIYDMVKGVERGAEIGPIRLISKRGGASGAWSR
jgi:cyclic pyranopterin phosphate synthase